MAKKKNIVQGLFGVVKAKAKQVKDAIDKSEAEGEARIAKAKKNSYKVRDDDAPRMPDGSKRAQLVEMFMNDRELGKKNIEAAQTRRKKGEVVTTPMDREENRRFQDPDFVDAWAYKKFKKLPGRRK